MHHTHTQTHTHTQRSISLMFGTCVHVVCRCAVCLPLTGLLSQGQRCLVLSLKEPVFFPERFNLSERGTRPPSSLARVHTHTHTHRQRTVPFCSRINTRTHYINIKRKQTLSEHRGRQIGIGWDNAVLPYKLHELYLPLEYLAAHMNCMRWCA